MNFILRGIVLTLFLLPTTYATTQFLTISDIHYGDKNISADGQDSGPELFKNALNKMKQLSSTVDFILFLGDIPTHSLFLDPQKESFEKDVFHGLYESDNTSKPIFYITGNNDSLAGNYQAFESNGISPLTYATDWQGACAHCNDLIIDNSHMYHDGYYSSYVMPNNKEVILIALNATQWTKIPWFRRAFYATYPNKEKEALEQLDWMDKQLKAHQAKQLIIAMHEPPGISYIGESIWYDQYVQEFIKIIAKYTHQYGQITLLSSHTHMDEFRKISLGNGINIYDYSTPSVGRNHHNYPGMKIFSMNKEYKVANFTTYYTSHLHKWNDQHYHALGTADAIFPFCVNKTLAECLDQLSVDEVCNNLDNGSFYGVKNPKVIDTSCRITYPVN